MTSREIKIDRGISNDAACSQFSTHISVLSKSISVLESGVVHL